MPGSPLPLILSGPLLRKVSTDEVVLWLVTSEPLSGNCVLINEAEQSVLSEVTLSRSQHLPLGKRCHLYLIQHQGTFPKQTTLGYDIHTQTGNLAELVPSLLYPGESRPQFIISGKADHIIHGSCRNPHDANPDALATAARNMESLAPNERPDMIMMTGDQIYADHVAGPVLKAIHLVIDLLQLPAEQFSQARFSDSTELYQHPDSYYGRDKLLPKVDIDSGWLAKLFTPRPQPVFTSHDNENHLISLAEFIAMYLLVWSPQLWQVLEDQRQSPLAQDAAGELTDKWQSLWQQELSAVRQFVNGLTDVQRLLAHLPSYMIFDDHDITDDWNLTVGWEKAALEHPLSRQIIGDGLLGYWLCQGWGNAPEQFDDHFVQLARDYFDQPSDTERHQILIDHLHRFERWHYTLNTEPRVVVLDTRTRRWRSESRLNKPSGLMDWEALLEFHQQILDQDKVVIVSAAPMFGVKFIEILQRIMTWLGKPLLVDAENWMAHPGSANTLISIFTHTKTPTNYVILSGDVHYSFAYDIRLRFRKSSPHIYQFTCSGFTSQFPEPLLSVCDAMDRLLYTPRSPLNWLTKRKRLKIQKRAPATKGSKRLVNASAYGEIKLDAEGKPEQVQIVTGDGQVIPFIAKFSQK